MKRKVCAILLTLGVVICQLSPSAMTVTEVRTGKTEAEMMTEATAEEIVADDAADELTVGAAEETAADDAADELTVGAAEDEPTIEEASETHSEQTPENEVTAETADSTQETDSSNTDLNREETETSSFPEENLVGEEAKDCSIYFSPDDASVGEMPDITVKAGTEYVLPECAYTCEGATFYMWNTSLGNKQAGDTIIVEEDVYVYPLWAEVIDRDSSPQDLSMTQVMGKLILTDKATGEVYTYTIDPGSLLNLSSYTYITKSTFDEPSNEIVEEYIEDIKESLKFHADQYLYKIDYTDFYHLDVETLTVSDPEIIDSKIYTENDTSYSKHWEDTFYTKTPIYPGDRYKLWQYTVTLEGEYSSSYPITVHWSSVDGEDLMEPLVFNLKTGSSFRDFEKQTSFFVKDGYVYSGHLLICPLGASDYSEYSEYEYYYSSTLTYSDIATGVSEREYVTKPLDLYCIMLKEVPAVELTVEPPASEAEIRRIQEYKKYNINSLSGVSAPNITVDTSECYACINNYDKNDSGNDFGRWEREDSEYLADKNINEQDLLFYTGISPKPGYIFTEDVQVTVNGATVQSMDLGTLWIGLCGSIAVQDSVKEDANACAISFTSGHSDSTGEMPAVTVNKGTEYVLPECAFTREDSAFYCWKVNGEEKQVGDTITVEQDTLLTAIWYYDVERDENPRDLSTTQVIAQLNLKDTKTGKVYTRTIDSCNEDDPNSYHYYYIDFITNSTFDDPYNSEVRQTIGEFKTLLQEYWVEFFDTSLLPSGGTLLLKNLDVSLPEVLETKKYEETTYIYEPAEGSDDYMRTTFIPGDYYNKWRYTVTLDAEYSDYASVTVHWSSVDGDDMREPFVITAALNTQLSTLEDQIPAFAKDGYINSNYYTLESYSEAATHDPVDWELDSSHDDFEETYLENDIDVYCIMRKILPEAEITVSVAPCGSGNYLDYDETFYKNAWITIETYECVYHMPELLKVYESNKKYGQWIDAAGETFYGDFIGGQEYLFTVSLNANRGYAFSEDTKIIINNGTFKSMTIDNGVSVDIYGSVTIEHSPSEAVKENIIEPTDTENGSFDLVIRCKGCGEILSSESFVINAPGNDWNEWNKSKDDTKSKVTYENTKGDGEHFTKGENKSLSFTFEGPFDDSEALSHFKGVRVDGDDISVANYIAETGRVAITLKINYLETLDAGWHTLTAVFDNGDDVKVSFKVEEGEKSAEEDDSSAVDDSSATEEDNTDSKDTSGESKNTPTGLPTIPITGIPENTDKNPTTTTTPTVTVTCIPENTEDAPTGLPTIPITGIPENTDKTPTTVPTGTVTTVPENTQELPTGLPAIPITGIPENTQESKSTAPARTVTNTSSGTQKAPAKTSSSRTTANTANTSGSAQKAPTRAATRAAATGDNNQIGVWVLLFVAALSALIGRRPGRKNN